MNIKEKCKALKDKNYNKLMAAQIATAKELDRALYEGCYTEEEIENLIKNKDYEAEFEESVKGLYDADKIHDHNRIVNETDIKALSQDMTSLEYEAMRMYMFDKEDNYLGFLEDSNEGSLSISKNTVDSLCRKVLMTENCAGVVVVHNHPFVAIAEPSSPDGISALKKKQMFGFFDITIIDDCIITEADFYSRKAADLAGETENKVFRPISDNLKNAIEKENKLFFRALQFTNVLS